MRFAVVNFKQTYTTSTVNSLFLVFGKLIRLVFVLIFLVSLTRTTKTIAGYQTYQVLLFFMTFNLVDMTVQLFFRGIYNAKWIVRHGEFDSFLTKPVSPLFNLMTRYVDMLDLTTLIPTIVILAVVVKNLENTVTIVNLASYFAMLGVAFIMAAAIHVAVAATSVLTQQVDTEIWIYRDLMTLGRFPIDVYAAPMRFLITFIVPIAVIVAFPAKALLGALSPALSLYAIGISLVALYLATRLWKFAISKYSSASN